MPVEQPAVVKGTKPQVKTHGAGMGVGMAVSVIFIKILNDYLGVPTEMEVNVAITSLVTSTVTWFSQKQWG